MKKYGKDIIAALLCFLIVLVFNFALPRMLPGNPVAYLTGFAEQDMTVTQYEHYRQVLHLDDSILTQFGHYLKDIFSGTLGYSFKKEADVSSLIGRRLGPTLQITVPAVMLSTLIGLFWGLDSGYRKGSRRDRASTAFLITLNTVPVFIIALVLVILFAFKWRILPYSGLNSPEVRQGTFMYFLDRIRHLVLPVLTLTLGSLPARYLLMRNTAAQVSQEKFVLYARERGLSSSKIKVSYIFRNIVQPFITMTALSVSTCIGGSLIIENIFSINGMGTLLSDAVYSLDYPLMQGILFVTTAIMTFSIIAADVLCIAADPRRRGKEAS